MDKDKSKDCIEDLKIESKTKNILIRELKLWIFLGGTILTVAVPYFQIRTDIALIQQSVNTINLNHETHIQDIIKNIEELKKADLNQDKEYLDLLKLIYNK